MKIYSESEYPSLCQSRSSSSSEGGVRDRLRGGVDRLLSEDESESRRVVTCSATIFGGFSGGLATSCLTLDFCLYSSTPREDLAPPSLTLSQPSILCLFSSVLLFFFRGSRWLDGRIGNTRGFRPLGSSMVDGPMVGGSEGFCCW